MIQARKQTRIPSVWTEDELRRLLNAVDRGNPVGKRDYAILLLACLLGLRVSDIKGLTFSCFDRDARKISFTQSKTRAPVVLPREARENQCSRASILRQFAIYLSRHGYEAYVLPTGFYRSGPQYTPYIYTDEELSAFFSATDCCHPVSECPYRHLVMPVFFRMIYACGLRSSEARLLKRGDVDLERGVLRILHAKKDRDRLVPMSDDLTRRCREYAAEVHSASAEDAWFFPGMNGKPISARNAYHNFRRFLRQAGISHGGRGHGPRIHDFRHTFCCRCLKKWFEEGKGLNVWLPILKTYVGHDSFDETAYYLRMTADAYGDIEEKIHAAFPDIIPEMEAQDEKSE